MKNIEPFYNNPNFRFKFVFPKQVYYETYLGKTCEPIILEQPKNCWELLDLKGRENLRNYCFSH
jgi:hypothetical protein